MSPRRAQLAQTRRCCPRRFVSAPSTSLAQTWTGRSLSPGLSGGARGQVRHLEDLGFCEKGEGGPFVSGGRISPGGELAVNTNGGGLSYNHPGMYGLLLIVEAVRQLRGECGERQVADANAALVHGNGGVLSSQVTAILGSEEAL